VQLQGRALSIGMRGVDVSLLHFELRLVGFETPEEESLDNHFGEGTHEAVLRFQSEFDLRRSGEVELATASRINEVIRERVPANEALEQLAETVKRTLELIDELEPDGDDLREQIERFSDRLRAFAIALSTLRELDAPEDLAAEVEEMLEAGSARLKELGDSIEDDGDGDTDSFVVRGRIASHELRGLPGLHVAAVDKNVGGDVALGEGTSGDSGAYEIRYAATLLQKQKPDVQVQVTDDNGEILAASPVRYNAGPEENGLDIVIPAEKLPPPAEYSRLVGELGGHLDAQDEPQLKERLAALKEDDRQQDITYLANKTGWDARMVAMTSLASQFGQRSGVEPEFYYALFRAGVPANEAVLSQLAPETVQQVWQRAVEQQILAPELNEKISESLESFKAHSADRLLEEEAQIGVSGFKNLIESTLGEQNDQQRLAELYYEKRGDLDGFWESARAEFPDEADRLQLDGKLGLLTVNNAPLIQRLHAQNGDLRTPLDLVRQGLYQSEAWEQLLGDDVTIPTEVPGEELEEKKANYAALMASQLRLSYPTAVVAEMVRADTISLRAEQPVKTAVTQFLDEHQGEFELGIHPVEQYLSKNDIELEGPVLAQVKVLQRAYQISPSDEVMGKLLEHNLDSAYAVVRYDEQSFVASFKDELGGEAVARLAYAKAHQVHHAVLNITTSYLLEKSSPGLYAIDNLAALDGANESGVLAYPILEGVLGGMDYCACEHCRSWLSPAAYLVDLLQFLDPPTHEMENPLDVLLGRRPDIQHLQLTCENTNTVLPYIDLVNEVLEHNVVNGSLDSFTGHDIEDGVTTEELLANPQFVNDAAYTELRNSIFPPPLPFHQPLEALRRYFERFDIPLHDAMERLRESDELERAGGIAHPAYGWQDVLMERLQLSRPEHAVLTDSGIPLQELYGEDPVTVTEEGFVDRFSNAKMFARRLNLGYEELIEIISSQFINPHSHLIPKLEKLGVNFATLQGFVDGTISQAEFEASLPDDLDVASYGGEVKRWVRDNETQIMGLIVLSDPTGSEDICSFDTVELRYALPDFASNKLKPIEFLKLLRFIRLWRKLGWSIEQTDKTIAALYPADQRPTPTDNAATSRAKLDAGFRSLILRLAHLQTVIEQLKLTPKRDLPALLACWSSLDTHGYRSLYRQMFLNPTILALDDVFQEDGYGSYLAEKREYQQPGAEPPKLLAHAEALRAALNLTQEELDLILQELDFDDDTVLDLETVSAVFRHGYLARKLRLSVREVLALKAMSGLDPFQPLDLTQPPDPAQPLGAVRPQAIRFIELAQQIKASPLKVSQLLYFLQHVDLGGEASPSQESVLTLARTLRNDLLRIDREQVVQEDPTGEIARAKMAMVYGGEATDLFFGLLANTSAFNVAYNHGQSALENDIVGVTDRITYDDFQRELTFRGVMTAAEKTVLEGTASATGGFRAAVQALFDAGQEAFAAFFDRYPELKGLYENFVDSNAPLEVKMSTLLADFLPDLRVRLKRQQVRQTISAQVDADSTLVTPLLENTSLLHAVQEPAASAIADFLALETQGMSADVFFAEDVAGDADQPDILVATIDYREGGSTLPPNPAGGNSTVSGRWRGFLEAPDNGHYNFYIEADAGAEISLMLGGETVNLVNNGVWQNEDAIELQAGQLYELALIAKKVKDVLILRWERKGMGRAPILAAQLYPAATLERFTLTYLRLLKALAIADALVPSSVELGHFATHDDYVINEEGWLNVLPAAPSEAESTTQALLRNVLALLRYRVLKEELKIRDERLAELLQDPSAVGEDGVELLGRATGWPEADRTALLDHFGLVVGDLTHLEHFVRLHDALTVVKKLGAGASALLEIATNEPTADTLRDLQGALRARYDDTPEPKTSQPTSGTMPARGAWPTNRDWIKLIQPINDELRALQRDALVALVLHRLQRDDETKHIDTPDKLFEHFLIDVEMDPCMKTSRIRQALSSVQLFIQRCLLNLESQVASSSIKANQWEWMKRYRVWEANRKVFLFPENWLEPELRDNKSPFFKDLEGELLQSDITDDAAATALVHYLEKLDEVAKLQICGMYYAENDLNQEADDVVHVIARTSGERRTYYYRRQEGGTDWTPWEKVDLNIEDNPVLPVVWRGRLFLFWLSVLQEAPPQATSSGSDTALDLTNVKPSQLKTVAGDAKARVTITLYWSEYYHGKWQPARTSDVNKPIAIGEFPPSGSGVFDRANLTLRSSEGNSGELIISTAYPGKPGTYYKIYNTHSLPIRREDDIVEPGLLILLLIRGRSLSEKNAPFTISYFDPLAPISEWSIDRKVLNKGALYEIIEPRHQVAGIFEAPFFFQDRRHAFFVKSEESRVLVGRHLDIGIWRPPPTVFVEPPVLVEPDFPRPPEEPFLPPDLIKPGVVDPSPLETFLREDLYVHQVMGTAGTIQFNGRLIGPRGSMLLDENMR
jgi:hypothetical protein